MTFGRIPLTMNLRGFVAAVRDLLVPILEDVQRFGLKARHLGKHRSRVDRFYREMITGQASVHDTITRYRKRFERYKESLFSFIENDGVPWHNNAAERALRHLAVQRKISGAFSEKGASDYLRLLAIAQTCRFQRKSFLGFLLSKSTSLTNTKSGAKSVRTGLPTPGRRNDAYPLNETFPTTTGPDLPILQLAVGRYRGVPMGTTAGRAGAGHQGRFADARAHRIAAPVEVGPAGAKLKRRRASVASQFPAWPRKSCTGGCTRSADGRGRGERNSVPPGYCHFLATAKST